MKTLDTNIFIRYFIKDDSDAYLKAEAVMNTQEKCYIPESVFPEIEYVLRGHYKLSKPEILKVFQILIETSHFEIPQPATRGLGIFAENKLDIVDCLVIAHALEKGELVSFDQKMNRVFEDYITS